ncbi:proprotein convertase P-domain-containing protein, partial [uncultured Psychroserpens sp.]|uniref:proprotein convertase P-domain-containing protein n=1 Tax=uncultured Psychroserpens sp. TaxID=255436 RepID=UPI00260240BF
MTFLFFGTYLTYGQQQFDDCPNNNSEMPDYSIADANNPAFGATLELATAVIGPGDDFCIGNDPGKDTVDGCGTFLFTGLDGGQNDCPTQVCFSPRQGCGTALGNVCVWIENPNSPGTWIDLGEPNSTGNGEVCITAPPGVSQFAITICRPGNGPVSVNDVVVTQAPELDLGEDQEACVDILPTNIDLTANEPAGQTGGTWSIGSGASGTASDSNNTSQNLPDGDSAGINSTVSIAGIPTSATLDIEVEVAMTHTYVGDLEIELIAPDGESIILLTRPGTGGGFGDSSNASMSGAITFSDTASVNAEDMGDTLNSSETICLDDGICDYLPNSGPPTSFAQLSATILANGSNPNGVWTLNVSDNANDDTGSLDSWSINIDWQDGGDIADPTSYTIDGNVGAMTTFTYTYDASSEAYAGCSISDEIKYTIVDDCCDNPINPSPSCNALKVIVVLDESGSIDSDTEEDVEDASLALANALKDTGAQMAFVEFASTAAIGNYGGFTNYNLVNDAYITALNDGATGLVAQYGSNANTSGEWTNWEDALNKVLDLNDIMVADIVLFMTDGNPTAYIRDSDNAVLTNQNSTTSLNNALDEACEVKFDGSHIFMLGVGNGISSSNLQAISGPVLDDGPGNPALTVLTADYGLITSGDLTQCFLDIAQSGCNNDLSLEKTVYAGHDNGASCSGLKTIPNPNDSQVTYCFTITNDGDQTISNIDFTDLDISIDENDLTPAFVTSMTSGQSITYYYETTFSGGQVFPFNNTAEVTGETPAGDPLSDTSSAEVTEPLCTPAATCNLQPINDESCVLPVAFTEPTDVFSGIEACGATVTMDHQDSGDSDVCGGADFTRTYTIYFNGQEFATCEQPIIITTPELVVSCPQDADVSLPSCSTEQEILDAYAIWSSGFGVTGGCNTVSNLGELPSLPS